MPEVPTVHFQYQDGKERTRIRYENGNSEDLALTRVGPDLYRLNESSFVGDAVFADVIHVQQLPDGTFHFLGIAERSPLVTQSWILSEQVISSASIRAILANITGLGGNWEQAFGGLLMIHVPPDSACRIFDEITATVKLVDSQA